LIRPRARIERSLGQRAWFIGPIGKTLAQMPASTQRNDSKEFVLICNVPIPRR